MTTRITSIDKGDFICWCVRDGKSWTVWDVGIAESTVVSGNGWIRIKFKRLGETDWDTAEIVEKPIHTLNFYDNTKGLKKKLLDQQGNVVWCLCFKVTK